MPVSELITNKIKKSLKNLGLNKAEVQLEHPAELVFGDYATNAAIAYSKELGLKPIEIASAIVKEFNDEPIPEVAKVEIAGFGFVNFHLSESYLIDQLKAAAFSQTFGQNKTLAGERILIDYTDPNPFKELHIGHLMNNVVGEVTCRFFENAGAEVKRACYQGDVGLHVAKTIYGLENLTFDYYRHRYLASNEAAAKFLGKAYALGAKVYEEDEQAKQRIILINSLVYGREDSKINSYYDWGRAVSLKYFSHIYKILDTKFDYFFFESETGPAGLEIVEREKQFFEESNGAVIFPGEKYGLHTRVFINGQGLPTYEAKELALFEKKKETYDFTKTYSVSANEVDSFFKVITGVLKLIHPKIGQEFNHISHGFLKLPSGKMSSRTGKVIAATTLIETVSGEIKEQFKSKNIDDQALQEIAVGAIKFSILRQAPGKDIIFDFNKSLSLEGDSGPYLAYAHARARSVLAKAEALGLKIETGTKVDNLEANIVSRLLYRFPEVVAEATENMAPQTLAVYLLNLASSFNRFYNEQKIIDENNLEQTKANLLLTLAFAEVIKRGLFLLSISAPSKM